MTTIAWDGKTLAADKQATSGNLMHTVTKIFKHPSGLYGVTGHLSHGLTVINWITGTNPHPIAYPANPSNDDYGYVIHINNQREIWCYEGHPTPCKFEDKFYAVGSGREFATAAMHCGQTAQQAIVIASIFNSGTGQGVDSLTLEDICE